MLTMLLLFANEHLKCKMLVNSVGLNSADGFDNYTVQLVGKLCNCE